VKKRVSRRRVSWRRGKGGREEGREEGREDELVLPRERARR